MLKSVSLSTAGLSEGEGLAYWRSITDGVYDLAPPRGGPQGYRFASRMWRHDDFVLSIFQSDPILKRRTRAQIRSDGRGYLKVRRYLSGRSAIVAGGRARTLAPGPLYLFDHSRETVEIVARNTQRNLFVPHAAVGYDPARHAACLDFGAGTPAGRMLGLQFDSIFAALLAGAEDEATRRTGDFGRALAVMLEGGSDSAAEGALRRLRRRAARDFIAAACGDPGLDAEAVARHVGASRATLYRDFGDEGGVMRVIRDHRLARAMEMLSAAPVGTGAVEATALATGFGSIHHFSNAFRDAFGVRPSAVLGTCPAGPAAAAAPEAASPTDEAARAVAALFSVLRAA